MSKTLFTKLAEVLAEVGRVPKNGFNDFHKYHYVMEADLLDAVRDKLSQRGVFVFASVDEVTKDGTLTTAKMTFTFADGETGETFAVHAYGTGDDKADKGVYKAITGATKYFVMKNFLVPTGDDPEGDTDTDKRASGRASQQSNKSPDYSALNAAIKEYGLSADQVRDVAGKPRSQIKTQEEVDALVAALRDTYGHLGGDAA